MYGYFACMNIHAPHVCMPHVGQKMVSETLALEFQRVVGCHVDTGNRIQVLREEQSMLLPLSHLSSPTGYF